MVSWSDFAFYGYTDKFDYRYGDAMLKKDFAEDSLQHELDLEKPLEFTCPIRILHGLDDQVK